MGDVLYRLDDNYALRGWEGLPFALTDLKHGTSTFFGREEFRFLLDCDGVTEIDVGNLGEKEAELFGRLTERGIVRACEQREPLFPEQEYRTYSNGYLSGVMFSITGFCNYRCRHCFMDAPEGKMGQLPTDEMLGIIDQLAGCGVMRVDLTGGEALVRDDFWQIVDRIRERGLVVGTLYTNGMLLSDSVLDRFEERGMRPAVTISFDGVGWHDWMRGVEGAEKCAIDAFRRLVDRGFACSAEMIVHRGNLGAIRDTVNLLGSLGVNGMKINSVERQGEWVRSDADDENYLTPAETFQAYVDYIPVYYADGAPIDLSLEGVFHNSKGKKDYVSPREELERSGSPEVGGRWLCGAMRMNGSIDPKGRIVPCLTLAYTGVAGNYPHIQEAGLKSILHDSTYWTSIRAKVGEYLEHQPECRECEYLHLCGGGCRANAVSTPEDTDFFAVDTRQCVYYKEGWMDRIVETVRRSELQTNKVQQG